MKKISHGEDNLREDFSLFNLFILFIYFFW